MISPNVAVTVAHNLYDASLGGWATSAFIFPACSEYIENGELNLSAPYLFATAMEIAISTQWYDTADDEYDWGVITFASNIGDKCGYLGMHFMTQNITSSTQYQVTISGYPARAYSSQETYNQYAHSGYLLSYSTNVQFVFNIDADGGQSGSPILYYVDGSWKTVGVYHGGTNMRNYGVRIYSQLFSFLWAYR